MERIQAAAAFSDCYTFLTAHTSLNMLFMKQEHQYNTRNAKSQLNGHGHAKLTVSYVLNKTWTVSRPFIPVSDIPHIPKPAASTCPADIIQI